MMKRAIALLVMAVVVPCCVSAQSWKFYRHELAVHVGASNFLGELGGANQEGTNGLRDLDIQSTREALGVGYRFKVSPYVTWRSSVMWSRIAGDDKLTQERFRQNRNLHFRSMLIETAQLAEFHFKERTGHLYRFKGVKGLKGGFFSPYFFTGIAGVYFSPHAQFTDGSWHALQPLGTEGQDIIPGKTKYSLFSIVIPYGIGVKYAIDKSWNIGIEYGLRLTFTDYMDDVSTDYWWNDQIQAANGNIAAYFADPSLDPTMSKTTTPEVDVLGRTYYPNRGDPTDNDAYMYTLVTLSYKLLKGHSNLPKF